MIINHNDDNDDADDKDNDYKNNEDNNNDDNNHLQVLELNLPTVCWQSVPEAAGRDGGHVFRHLVMNIVL